MGTFVVVLVVVVLVVVVLVVVKLVVVVLVVMVIGTAASKIGLGSTAGNTCLECKPNVRDLCQR